MKKLQEVTVFTNGDSGKIKTWSNVPFFFTETLISKGIKVNRVNLESPYAFETLSYKILDRVIKLINKRTTYSFYRSNANFLKVRNRIKTAVRQYPHSEADIFLTFSFSSVGLTDKPVIQFCDWTYHHYFQYFAGRKPDDFETACIEREDSQIMGSDLIIPLFPGVADYMINRYKGKNISYLGNVINSLFNATEEDMSAKMNSNSLLFIGSKKYMEGALSLIEAFKQLKQQYPKLELHIIGIETTGFRNLPKDVFCYGYLDKGKDADRELYYKLLKEAKIFINTTPKWSSFSASIEAMYFYIPVIITPYDDFLKTFGDEINFGLYCEENSQVLIEKKITEILTSPSYQQLCLNAHAAVKEFTWDTYMDKVITKIEEVIAQR